MTAPPFATLSEDLRTPTLHFLAVCGGAGFKSSFTTVTKRHNVYKSEKNSEKATLDHSGQQGSRQDLEAQRPVQRRGHMGRQDLEGALTAAALLGRALFPFPGSLLCF